MTKGTWANVASYEIAAADPYIRTKFVEQVTYSGPDGCWEWQGFRNRLGYGLCSVSRAVGHVYAHRLALHFAGTPVPENLVTDHLCRNPPCVNPAHLEIVTQRTNNRRGNGVAGRNIRKTHCKNGHAFTPENTGIAKSHGVVRGRRCKACAHDRYLAARATT